MMAWSPTTATANATSHAAGPPAVAAEVVVGLEVGLDAGLEPEELVMTPGDGESQDRPLAAVVKART